MAQQVYVTVTPSDVTTYAPAISTLHVGSTGDIAILGNGDTNSVVLKSVPAGKYLLPYPVSKVLSTGTTASNLVGAQTG